MNHISPFMRAVALFVALLVPLGTAPVSLAATLYWDGGTVNIGTNGNGVSGGATGNWNTALTNWDTGVAAHAAWVNANNDTAFFAGTAGAVTLTAPVTVGGLTFFGNSGYSIVAGTQGLTFGATDNTIGLINQTGTTASVTISGTVGGAGNVILTSINPIVSSTLNLTGTSTAGWTGTTAINTGATLSLSGLNQGLVSTLGSITLNGGNITLTSADSAAEEDLDRVRNGTAISSNGGTFTYTTTTATSTRTFTETIGSVDLVGGQTNFFNSLDKSAGSQTLTLSGLTHTGATSVVTFNNAGGLNLTNDIIRVDGIASDTPAGEIIGAWATYGTSVGSQTDYAIYDSDGTFGRVVNATTTLTAPGESGWSSSTTAYRFGALATLSADRTAAALRYTGGADSLALAGFTLKTDGILNGGSGLLTVSGLGALTANGVAGGNLYLTAGAAAITVSSAINDNGGAVTVVKSGSGNLTLSSTASTYSGGTVVNAGTLTWTANTNLGSVAANRDITVNGNATLAGQDGTSLDTLAVGAGGLANFNTSSYTFATTTGTGAISYLPSAAGKTLNLGNASGFTGSAQVLMGGTTNAGPTLTFSSLGDGVGSTLSFAGGNGDGGQSATITLNGSAALTFNNRQIQILSRTISNHGVLQSNLINNSANAAHIWTINTDLAVLTDQTGRNLNFRGTNTGNNAFNGIIGDGGAGGSVNITKQDGGRWNLGGNNTFTGSVIANGGTLQLSGTNQYTGSTTISIGTLIARTIKNFGTASSLGKPASGSIPVSAFGTSVTLSYDGSGDTSNRTFSFIPYTISDSPAFTLTNDGSGALIFNGSSFNVNSNTASRLFTFTVGGTYTGGTNEIQGVIQNYFSGASDTVNVAKSGAGTWKFSGTNTYTGTTTISNGTLAITTLRNVGNGGSSLGAPTSAAGGTIAIGSTATAGALRYDGTGSTSDRVINLAGTTGGASLSQEGTGVWRLTSNLTATGSGVKTLTLGGSTAGIGEIAGAIVNSASATSVAKTGTGTWLLAGANTYSGTTAISNGTLSLTGSLASTAISTSATGAIIQSAAGLISGTSSIVQGSSGTSILSGSNTYTGNTTINAGTLVAQHANALGTGGTRNVSVAAGADLNYAAAANANLSITGTLGITGGAGTVIGGSIGSSTTGAQINVTGNATASGAINVNIYGVNGVSALGGTNTYTLVHGVGGGSAMSSGTYTLGNIFNATNFTVGALSSTAADLQVSITSVTALPSAYWTGGLSGSTNVWAASDGTANSNWLDSAGGATPLVPGSTTDVIISSRNLGSPVVPVLDPTATVLGASMTIRSLTISDTTSGLGLNADGNTLTIANAAGITMDASVPASTIAANVDLGANQTWTNNSANTLNVSGAVSGAFTLTKAGTGNITLSGANTFSGLTTISAGTLTIANSLALRNSALVTTSGTSTLSGVGNSLTIGGLSGATGDLGSANVLNGYTGTITALTLNPQTGVTVTYGGVIGNGSGAMTLAKTGAGIQILSGTNTYTGTTTISAGTLRAGAAAGGQAFGSGSAVTTANAAGAALDLNGFSQTIGSLAGGGTTGGHVTLGANATLTSGGNNATTTFAGNITGTGTSGLTKNGTGILILNGTSSFTGNIAINGGTLQIGTNGTTATLGTYAGNILNNGTLDFQTGANNTLSGVISGSGPILHRNAGTLTLSGSNTYTGKTTINAITNGTNPTLVVSSFNSVNSGTPLLASSSLGAPTTIANGTIEMGSANSGPNPTLRYTGTGETTDRVIHMIFNSTATRTLEVNGTGLLKFTSAFTGTGQASGGVTLTGTGRGEIAGGLPTIGSGSLIKSGTGTWRLSGTNLYAALTNVTDGTLIVTKSRTSAINAGLTVAANKQFIYAPTAAGALNLGSGVLTLSSGTTTRIGTALGGTASQSAITSSAAASLAGTGKVDIYGITGVAPTAGSNNLITALSGLTGGTYTLGTVYNNTDFTVSGFTRAAAAISVTVTAQTAITDAFWKGGLSGNTNVWAASDGSANSNWTTTAGGAVQALTPGSTATVTISATSPTTAPTATVLGADMSILGLVISDTTNGLGLNADGNYLTIGTGGITMDASVPTSTIAANVILGGNQTWTNNSANTLNVSKEISGSGNLTKAGTGTVNLSGFNSYTGTTSITGGKLTVSSTGIINRTSGLTINGATADFNYNGSNPYTAPLTFTQGTLSGTNWAGTLSGLTINTNRTISPGNSPGTARSVTQTWAGGGTYQWEINNTTGTIGLDPGWDWLNLSGALTQTSTSGNKFTIDITGLNTSNVAGIVSNWNPASSSTYIIASAAGGITGFDATGYTLNLANFTNNNTSAGTWSILQGDGINGGTVNDILLSYVPSGGIPTAFWSGATNGNWGTANNWNTTAGGGVPIGAAPSVVTDVHFSTTTPVPANLGTVNLGANFTVKTLAFDAASTAVTIGSTGGFVLTITPTSAANGINVDTTAGDSTLSVKVELGAAQTWTVNANRTLTANGVVSGAFGLTKAGLGDLVLGGSNTYTGVTQINQGKLKINDLTNLGAGGVGNSVGIDGGTLQSTSNTYALGANRSILLGAGGGTIDTVAGGVTVDGIVSGTGALTKSGAGILTLSATNTYTGNTNLNAGTINLGAAENAGVSGPLGNQAANAAGTIVMGGGTLQYSASNTFDYSGRFSTAASQAYNVDTNGQSVIWATALTSSGGTLTKLGTGTLSLNGTNANTYDGLTTVNGGTLDLNKTAGVNAIAGDLLINGGTVKLLANEQIANTATVTQTAGAFNLNGKTETIVSYNKTGGTFTTGRGGSLIGTGASITYDGAGSNQIEVDSSVVDGHVTLTNGATLDLAGANAPFDLGPAGTNGGILQISSGGTGLEMNGTAGNTINLASDTNSTTAARIVLDDDVTTGGTGLNTIASTGVAATKGYVALGASGSRTFTVGDSVSGTGTDLDISAVISSTGAGLTKAGAGTLATSAVNTYTGATSVNAGIFQVGVAGVGSTHADSDVTATSATFTTATTGAGVNANNVAVTGQTVITVGPVVAGSGTIFGDLTVGTNSSNVGVIRPGDVSGSSNGTLTIGGNLVVNNGSQIQMGLASTTQNDAAFNWYVPTGGQNALTYLTSVVTAGDYTSFWDSADGGYDSINATGTLSLGTGGTDYPTHIVSVNPSYTPVLGDIFKLLNWSGIGFHDPDAIGGTHSLPGDLVLPTLAAGFTWDTSAYNGFGVVVVIPEPGRMMLLFFGLAALFLRRRRK